MKKWIETLLAILVGTFWFLALTALVIACRAGSKESDPAVYERYVQDMQGHGRKPNGELLEPDAFEDSIYWIRGKE